MYKKSREPVSLRDWETKCKIALESPWKTRSLDFRNLVNPAQLSIWIRVQESQWIRARNADAMFVVQLLINLSHLLLLNVTSSQAGSYSCQASNHLTGHLTWGLWVFFNLRFELGQRCTGIHVNKKDLCLLKARVFTYCGDNFATLGLDFLQFTIWNRPKVNNYFTSSGTGIQVNKKDLCLLVHYLLFVETILQSNYLVGASALSPQPYNLTILPDDEQQKLR